ncbi:hypothetical protein BJX65DRAFT_134950 [Aspergillus insuetus]
MTIVHLRSGVCNYCKKRGDVLPCTKCLGVLYCKEEHEVADRSAHRPECLAVSRAKTDCQLLNRSRCRICRPAYPGQATASRLELTGQQH